MVLPKKIIIVTHDMFYGVPHALRDYLLNKKIENVIFIGHPLVEQRKSSLSIYKNGKKVRFVHVNQRISGITSYFLDLFLTLYWVLAQKEKYELFIGVDMLNAFAGIILRKIGKVEKVVFYAMDFVPARFHSTLLNNIYKWIEVYCVKNADDVWNVSPKIAEGRERFLHLKSRKYSQKVVNSGIWMNKIKRYPFSTVKKHQLLFLGHILKKQGLQMVLEALPEVVSKIPDFKFIILGGGEYEEPLKNLAEKLHIDKYVEFKGWIKDRKIIDTTLGQSAAAIVVYVPEKERIHNFSYYGDPIKIKEYLASGLPVILTDVPHNAHEIARRKCGFVVQYQKKAISNAIISLLSDEKRLKQYRENARIYAQEFDWNVIFAKAFRI